MKLFNIVLVANRILKNLTIKQVSKLLNIKEGQYTNIEQGSTKVKIPFTNEEIAKKLNFDVNEFKYNLLNCINQDLTNLEPSYVFYYGDYAQGTTYRELSILIKLLFKQPVSLEIVKEEFEMSLSSFKRTIAMLRGILETSENLRGTIQYNPKKKTYYLVLSNTQINI